MSHRKHRLQIHLIVIWGYQEEGGDWVASMSFRARTLKPAGTFEGILSYTKFRTKRHALGGRFQSNTPPRRRCKDIPRSSQSVCLSKFFVMPMGSSVAFYELRALHPLKDANTRQYRIEIYYRRYASGERGTMEARDALRYLTAGAIAWTTPLHETFACNRKNGSILS